MSEVKERPILFTAEMIRAILAGHKTMTRRILKPQPDEKYSDGRWYADRYDHSRDFVFWGRPGTEKANVCGLPFFWSPYGDVGERLWCRETWALQIPVGASIHAERVPYYRADHDETFIPPRWKPSIFMPRWASRITLEITGVKAERLQDISEEDAIAEGVGHGFRMNAGWPDYGHIVNGVCTLTHDSARMSFATLWDAINGKDSWALNPWLWVISFKRLEQANV